MRQKGHPVLQHKASPISWKPPGSDVMHGAHLFRSSSRGTWMMDSSCPLSLRPAQIGEGSGVRVQVVEAAAPPLT